MALAAFTVLVFGAACSSGQAQSFSIKGATADPTYWCPGNANNAPYDVHAGIAVHNGTQSPVTISSITANLTLQSIGGAWLEKVGDVYDAGATSFQPSTINPGASTTIKVTIKSACTSPAYGTAPSSFGEYRVTMRVATSAGTYSVSSANLHRIEAA